MAQYRPIVQRSRRNATQSKIDSARLLLRAAPHPRCERYVG